MIVTQTDFPGMRIIEPRVFEDHRGWFSEIYQRQKYAQNGLVLDFVQDNYVRSRQGTLRGLHYQLPLPQGKLLWVLNGEILDVVVDLRRGSPTFQRWMSLVLSSANRKQMYVPPGFAHGYFVISEFADVLYKCTEFHSPQTEHVLRWDDPELAISWPSQNPTLSDRDRQGKSLRESQFYEGEFADSPL